MHRDMQDARKSTCMHAEWEEHLHACAELLESLESASCPAAADKLAVGWCGGIFSSKGVSGYEQQANVTSPMADISRMLPTGGGHMRIGGKVRAYAHF